MLNKPIQFHHFYLICFFLIFSPLFSQSTFRSMMENDTFFPPSDKYFTNGLRFEYWGSIATRTPEDKYWVGCESRKGLQLGQNIYTPSNIRKADPGVGDRPYAGYLYFGGAYGLTCGDWQNKIELNVGATGNPSLAEQGQEILHRNIGSAYPIGWSKQIPGTGVVQINYENRYAFSRFFSWYSYLQMGNLFQSVSTGPSFRIGNIKSLHPTGYNSMQTGLPFQPEMGEWYFYIQPTATYMEYDGTLQGAKKAPLRFGDTTTVARDFLTSPDPNNPLTANLQTLNTESTAVRFYRFLLSYRQNLPFQDSISFFIYNALFNGNQVLNGNDRILPIYFFIRDNQIQIQNLTDDQRLFLFLNMNNNSEGKYSEPIRVLALKIFLESNRNPGNISILDLLVLRELSREDKPRYTDPMRYQGKIESGFVVALTNSSFLQFGAIYQTADFKNAPDLPNYQVRGFIQYGQRF